MVNKIVTGGIQSRIEFKTGVENRHKVTEVTACDRAEQSFSSIGVTTVFTGFLMLLVGIVFAIFKVLTERFQILWK